MILFQLIKLIDISNTFHSAHKHITMISAKLKQQTTADMANIQTKSLICH